MGAGQARAHRRHAGGGAAAGQGFELAGLAGRHGRDDENLLGGAEGAARVLAENALRPIGMVMMPAAGIMARPGVAVLVVVVEGKVAEGAVLVMLRRLALVLRPVQHAGGRRGRAVWPEGQLHRRCQRGRL